MVRAVTCRSSGGLVMSEEQCDQSLRPLAVYPCGDRDCAPHWVEQEWQQVKASKTAKLSLLSVVTEVILTTFLRTIRVLGCV